MEDQKLFCFDQAFLKHVVNYDVNVQCDKIWDRNLFNLFIEVQRNTNYPRLMHLLNKCNENDVHMIIKVVFYIRGIRNKGRGERKIGRQCYQWLLIKYPLIFRHYFDKIPNVGRWDDIFWLFPNVLNLSSTRTVKNNFLLKAYSSEELQQAVKLQNEIVEFVGKQFFADFRKMYSNEKVSLLAKWIPSENSLFNKKYSIIDTIIKPYKISKQVFRTIYLIPLRAHLPIVERLMCNKNWKAVNYNNLNNKSRIKYKNAFRRHDNKNFRKYMQDKFAHYILHPQKIVEQYLQLLLTKSNIKEQLLLESQYKMFINIYKNADIHANVILPVIDTNGVLYTKLYNNIKLISKYIIIALLAATLNGGKIAVFHKMNGFQILNVNGNTLLQNIKAISSMFTTPINIKNFAQIKTDFKNIIILSSEDIDESVKAKPFETVLFWNAMDTRISFYKKDNIKLINGYSEEIFRYILFKFDYSPQKIFI